MSLTNLRKFMAGDYFIFLLFAFSVVVIITNQFIIGSLFFGLIASLVLFVSDDILSFLSPVMFLMGFVIQAFDPKDEYMPYFPLIIVPIAAVIFHIVYYRKGRDGFKMPGKMPLLLPMILTAITCFTGGIGTLKHESYFSSTSLVYMFGLGFMEVIIYIYLHNHIGPGLNYTDDIGNRFAKLFTFLSLFLFVAAVEGYIEHWDKFIVNPGILYFQWRNNASTILMMAMPFSIYLALRKFPYIAVTALSYVTIVLLGSRGGLVFGGIEFIALIIYFIVKDKEHRKIMYAIIAIVVVALAVLSPKIISFMSYTIHRFTAADQNVIRLEQWKRSIVDFRHNPIFGMGLGYMGNRDIHPSKVASLCWYHSSIPQVIGSFGLVGILTYGYQFICRVKFLNACKAESMGRAVIGSFIGLELMSLVNPGIFTLIFPLILNVELVILEKYFYSDKSGV